MNDRCSSSIDVDRLAIDAFNLSNETSVSALWKRRHVHGGTLASNDNNDNVQQHQQQQPTSHAAAGDSNDPVTVNVDRMNHIVIVVPTAFPHVGRRRHSTSRSKESSMLLRACLTTRESRCYGSE
jgi:hypothetical protein